MPNNQDQAFVAAYEYDAQTTEAKHILADATYKLVYEGYPSLTIRTTDKNKNFHHFGIGITTNEKHEDYAFLFKALKYTVEAVEGVEYEPDTLIADNAHGITNGLLKVFNLKKRFNCWAHAIRNIDSELNRIGIKYKTKNQTLYYPYSNFHLKNTI